MLRDEASLSVEEAAERIGVSERQYRRWEGGESIPQPRHIRELARVFDTTPTYLIGNGPAHAVSDVLARVERIEAMLDAITQHLGLPTPPNPRRHPGRHQGSAR